MAAAAAVSSVAAQQQQQQQAAAAGGGGGDDAVVPGDLAKLLKGTPFPSSYFPAFRLRFLKALVPKKGSSGKNSTFAFASHRLVLDDGLKTAHGLLSRALTYQVQNGKFSQGSVIRLMTYQLMKVDSQEDPIILVELASVLSSNKAILAAVPSIAKHSLSSASSLSSIFDRSTISSTSGIASGDSVEHVPTVSESVTGSASASASIVLPPTIGLETGSRARAPDQSTFHPSVAETSEAPFAPAVAGDAILLAAPARFGIGSTKVVTSTPSVSHANRSSRELPTPALTAITSNGKWLDGALLPLAPFPASTAPLSPSKQAKQHQASKHVDVVSNKVGAYDRDSCRLALRTTVRPAAGAMIVKDMINHGSELTAAACSGGVSPSLLPF